MLQILSTTEVWYYVLFVGFFAATVYDLWWLLMRAMGVIIMDWGLLGRWALGVFRGRAYLCTSCEAVLNDRVQTPPTGFAEHLLCDRRMCDFYSRPSVSEILTGRLLHYGLSMVCAVLLPLLWGEGYLLAPRLAPALFVGFCLISLAGQVAILPGLSRQRSRNPRRVPMVHALMLSSNMIFSTGLYLASVLWSGAGVTGL